MNITNRDLIINSAIELLKIHQFEDITIKDICSNAGISRQTFYNYFKNKDEVFRVFFVKASSHLKLFNPPFENGYLENKEYIDDLVAFCDNYSDVLMVLQNQNILWYLSKDLVNAHKASLISFVGDPYVKNYPDYFYIYTMSTTTFICLKWIKKGKTESREDLIKIIKHYIDSNY